MSLATAWTASLQLMMATRNPLETKRRAQAVPMPLLPVVTIATGESDMAAIVRVYSRTRSPARVEVRLC